MKNWKEDYKLSPKLLPENFEDTRENLLLLPDETLELIKSCYRMAHLHEGFVYEVQTSKGKVFRSTENKWCNCQQITLDLTGTILKNGKII